MPEALYVFAPLCSAPEGARHEALIVAQGDHRVDAGGAAGGDVDGGE
jgi:hypothetical protein